MSLPTLQLFIIAFALSFLLGRKILLYHLKWKRFYIVLINFLPVAATILYLKTGESLLVTTILSVLIILIGGALMLLEEVKEYLQKQF